MYLLNPWFYPVSLLVELRPARQCDFEEIIKEFSAKLSLVPLPPPGQLHVVRKYSFPLFNLGQLYVQLSGSWCFCVVEFQPSSPSSGSSIKGGSGQAYYWPRPAFAFPLFQPHDAATGKHIIWSHKSEIGLEPKIVLCSGAVLPPPRAEVGVLLLWLGQTHSCGWEFAALPAGHYLALNPVTVPVLWFAIKPVIWRLFQPLLWQQPYVPVLASGMLDFLMAPTAFLMGCHISHFEEVAAVSTYIAHLDLFSRSSSFFFMMMNRSVGWL